jgi:glycine dehydrogenase subunit 1
MYGWGSAAAEAVLMALRVNKNRGKVILPANMNPLHKKVIETYTWPHNIKLEIVPYDKIRGTIDIERVKELVDSNTAAVYVQYPNFFGIIEPEVRAIGELAHEKGSLFITGVYPIALGLLKPPGELGADIAVGEGQPLGLGLNYGGPYLGVFATRYDMNLIRQMPGRIIGLAESIRGERCFAMILQTREQHIRRARATSNICTNEALVAIAAAIYLSMLGKNGVVKLAEINYYNAHYAWIKMKKNGLNVEVFKEDFFNEFPISFNEFKLKYSVIHEKLLEKGIHGGLYIGKYYPELGETALFAFTEGRFGVALHEIDEEIKNLVGEVKIPSSIKRTTPPQLPELSEVEVVRHFTNLTQMSYGVDNGPVPLGSCTMKYNPRIAWEIAFDPRITELHPLQDEKTVQGLLGLMYELQRWLANIIGMDVCTLHPAAGAHGELAGVLTIRKYH